MTSIRTVQGRDATTVFLKRNAIEHYKLTNMVLAMMVAVEMDNKQLASRHVVVIRQVVAISSKNSSACFFFKS